MPSLPVASSDDTLLPVAVVAVAVAGAALAARAAWLRSAGRRFAAVRGPRFERSAGSAAPGGTS